MVINGTYFNVISSFLIPELRGEPFPQLGITFLHDHVVDGIGRCLRGAHDDADFLGPGDTRINEISLEHHEMGHQQWDDHHGIFRAL